MYCLCLQETAVQIGFRLLYPEIQHSVFLHTFDNIAKSLQSASYTAFRIPGWPLCLCGLYVFTEVVTPVRPVRPLVQQVVRGTYVHVMPALPTV